MNSTDFVKSQLIRLAGKFPSIQIRYEYDQFQADHIIEVRPLSLYEGDDRYWKEEHNISLEFNELFPLESIIFISDNSLIQIQKADFQTVGISNQLPEWLSVHQPIMNNHNYLSDIDACNHGAPLFEINYALAA